MLIASSLSLIVFRMVTSALLTMMLLILGRTQTHSSNSTMPLVITSGTTRHKDVHLRKEHSEAALLSLEKTCVEIFIKEHVSVSIEDTCLSELRSRNTSIFNDFLS